MSGFKVSSPSSKTEKEDYFPHRNGAQASSMTRNINGSGSVIEGSKTPPEISPVENIVNKRGDRMTFGGEKQDLVEKKKD